MDKLLADDGCPWDNSQTHESLRPYLIEESYEVVDAINKTDMPGLQEELGDVLMEVLFHAKIAEKEGSFSLADVINTVSEKMIRRHPHIFGSTVVHSAEEVSDNWDKIKAQEKKYANPADHLKAVPRTLPALMRAEKVQSRGHESKTFSPEDARCWAAKLENLLNKAGADAAEPRNITENSDIGILIGQLLFQLVRISRFFSINPEFALTNATETYITNFEHEKTP
jgi:tetrapyrrole methylase family protein/MazG family protein